MSGIPDRQTGESMTTRKRHNPEQIVRKLTQADKMLASGAAVANRVASGVKLTHLRIRPADSGSKKTRWQQTGMSDVHGHVEVSTFGQKKSPLLGLPF